MSSIHKCNFLAENQRNDCKKITLQFLVGSKNIISKTEISLHNVIPELSSDIAVSPLLVLAGTGLSYLKIDLT